MTAQTVGALFCILLLTQYTTAVVNNAKVESTTVKIEEINSTTSHNSVDVADSIASETEQKANRRETPVLPLSDSYGAPLISSNSDSYAPTGQSNLNLPIPVYGVPDAPSNNIVYPAPPPDIPPPPPPANAYGPPSPIYGPPKIQETYGPPPQTLYGPPPILPANNFGSPPVKYIHQNLPQPGIPPAFHSPKFPKISYGPPKLQYRPPKPVFVPKGVKPNYLPPKPPKPIYGLPPPKPIFSHTKTHKPTQVIVSVQNLNGPQLKPHYGPPEPIPHGPPHPGVPAPPTPPDIKYDGWQPIPGLVSRPPHPGANKEPQLTLYGNGGLHVNADFSPPPVEAQKLSLSSHSSSYSSSHHDVRDSYRAPLNVVTGSGGVVTSSGDAHHDGQSLSLGLSAAGITNNPSHLSVIKSIGYELFPNSGIGGSYYSLGSLGSLDSYSAPPLNSYSPDGPYAAAHPYKLNTISSSFGSFNSLKSQSNSHGLSLSSSGVGLIPPSGLYGVPPSGQYGTPLLSKPNIQYGAPLNALKINPPKHPVIFREPVPAGLIESVGKHTAHKDAHGIIESSHSSNFNGPTYIPPPIPDITKHTNEEPLPPSTLYSLPNPTQIISFQSTGLGASNSLNSNAFNFDLGQTGSLSSYTVPLSTIDGAYSLPLHSGDDYSISLDHSQPAGVTVGIDNSHPPITIDLTSNSYNDHINSYNAHSTSSFGVSSAADNFGSSSSNYVGTDCPKSHLPSLSYNVPSTNSYTSSLSALTTNIGGGAPAATYGPPDLHASHSQKIVSGATVNSIESDVKGKSFGKALTNDFAPGTELIKSESLDINNIPLDGSLGSYTLQIQSADGSDSKVPHAQVLNDGLLQSILAAIEQPQQKSATLLNQRTVQSDDALYESNQSVGLSDIVQDTSGDHSVTNPVIVPAPSTEAITKKSSTTEPNTSTESTLHLIDNNGIALYFNNNSESNSDTDKLNNSNSTNSESTIRNGQQYGSYVSFKTSNGGYSYGDLVNKNNGGDGSEKN